LNFFIYNIDLIIMPLPTSLADTNSPFLPQLEKAFTSAIEILSLTDFKPPYTDSRGTQIAMKDLPNAPLPLTKGRVVFPAAATANKFTPEDVMDTIMHLEARKVWDGRFEGATIIEGYGEERNGRWYAGVLHSLQKGQWPVVR
jgi:hypothetical protein